MIISRCREPLESSGSVASSRSLKLGLAIQPHLSHEQDNPHAHNTYNYNRIVRERGRQVIQKMWRWEQEHDVIGTFYHARVRKHQVAPNDKVLDIVREETAESTSGEPSYGKTGCPGLLISAGTGEDISARIHVTNSQRDRAKEGHINYRRRSANSLGYRTTACQWGPASSSQASE